MTTNGIKTFIFKNNCKNDFQEKLSGSLFYSLTPFSIKGFVIPQIKPTNVNPIYASNGISYYF